MSRREKNRVTCDSYWVEEKKERMAKLNRMGGQYGQGLGWGMRQFWLKVE